MISILFSGILLNIQTLPGDAQAVEILQTMREVWRSVPGYPPQVDRLFDDAKGKTTVAGSGLKVVWTTPRWQLAWRKAPGGYWLSSVSWQNWGGDWTLKEAAQKAYQGCSPQNARRLVDLYARALGPKPFSWRLAQTSKFIQKDEDSGPWAVEATYKGLWVSSSWGMGSVTNMGLPVLFSFELSARKESTTIAAPSDIETPLEITDEQRDRVIAAALKEHDGDSFAGISRCTCTGLCWAEGAWDGAPSKDHPYAKWFKNSDIGLGVWVTFSANTPDRIRGRRVFVDHITGRVIFSSAGETARLAILSPGASRDQGSFDKLPLKKGMSLKILAKGRLMPFTISGPIDAKLPKKGMKSTFILTNGYAAKAAWDEKALLVSQGSTFRIMPAGIS